MYYIHPVTEELLLIENGTVVRMQPLGFTTPEPIEKLLPIEVSPEVKRGRPKLEHSDVPGPAHKRGEPRTCCGSRSSKHMKGCSMAGKPTPIDSLPTDEKRLGAMTQKHFASVKIAQQHDLPGDTIAFNLGVTQKEVERAILAVDYDTYCKKL